MKTSALLLLGLGLTAPLAYAETVAPAQPGGKLPNKQAIQLVQVATGLVDPIHVTGPKDGSGRLFICERHGIVRIVKDGKLQEKPFLDLRDKTLSSFLEEGLFCIEFHPKFKENGLFYIAYSDLWFNGSTLLMQYKVSAKTLTRPTWTAARSSLS